MTDPQALKDATSDPQALKDATNDPQHYLALYEELAEKLPEAALAHPYRGPGSRYWTVLEELTPFARRGDRLLDVGCNDGIYTLPYCQAGGQALGIDIAPTVVQRAQARADRLGVRCHFTTCAIDSPAAAGVLPGPFDVVLCSEVLGQLLDPARALRTMHDVLRPGGHLVLTTATPLNPTATGASGPVDWPALWRYVARTLSGTRLLERHVVETEVNPVIRAYGVSAYRYRVEGYYPRALAACVEGVGFRCIRLYTIERPTPVAVLRRLTCSLLRRPAQVSGPGADAPGPGGGATARRVRRAGAAAYFRLERRVPLLSLLGLTAVGVFRKGAAAPHAR